MVRLLITADARQTPSLAAPNDVFYAIIGSTYDPMKRQGVFSS